MSTLKDRGINNFTVDALAELERSGVCEGGETGLVVLGLHSTWRT